MSGIQLKSVILQTPYEMEFCCQLSTRAKIERVEFALAASPNVLGINAFIVTLNIDDPYSGLSRFWTNIDLAKPIALTNATVRWISYSGLMKTQKHALNRLLDSMGVIQTIVDVSAVDEMPELREDIDHCGL